MSNNSTLSEAVTRMERGRAWAIALEADPRLKSTPKHVGLFLWFITETWKSGGSQAVTYGQIGERMGISAHTVKMAVRDLVATGYIRKSGHPTSGNLKPLEFQVIPLNPVFPPAATTDERGPFRAWTADSVERFEIVTRPAISFTRTDESGVQDSTSPSNEEEVGYAHAPHFKKSGAHTHPTSESEVQDSTAHREVRCADAPPKKGIKKNIDDEEHGGEEQAAAESDGQRHHVDVVGTATPPAPAPESSFEAKNGSRGAHPRNSAHRPEVETDRPERQAMSGTAVEALTPSTSVALVGETPEEVVTAFEAAVVESSGAIPTPALRRQAVESVEVMLGAEVGATPAEATAALAVGFMDHRPGRESWWGWAQAAETDPVWAGRRVASVRHRCMAPAGVPLADVARAALAGLVVQAAAQVSGMTAEEVEARKRLDEWLAS